MYYLTNMTPKVQGKADWYMNSTKALETNASWRLHMDYDFWLHGACEHITYDRGGQFTLKLALVMTTLLNIKHHTSIVYKIETDEQTVRANAFLN